MLKNKGQPSKSEALIGFIIQFMNQAASHQATGRVLWGAVQIIGRKSVGMSELFQARSLSLRGRQGLLSGRFL